MLNKLKQLFIFSALTLSLNVSAVDIQAFNKEAYLDLSKPYFYNWNNKTATRRKESQARKIFKQFATESAKTARQTLGSTNSDNTSEFGKKFKKSLKQSLKSQAVSKTQSYINSKAKSGGNNAFVQAAIFYHAVFAVKSHLSAALPNLCPNLRHYLPSQKCWHIL